MILKTFLMLCAGSGLGLFLPHESFGKQPEGERRERIILSPNYVNGEFRNETLTPRLTEGVSLFTVYKDFLFASSPHVRPEDVIPVIQTDLLSLPPQQNMLIWFGHSSYFMQVDGKKMVVDPIFSPSAAPVPFVVREFPASYRYTANDLPSLDYVFITHDHWDHLDYKSILALQNKTNKFICSLGVGAHLEYWGIPRERIFEGDWYDSFFLDSGFTAHVTPTHHFSGRGLKANQTLWASFVLQTPTKKLYFGGDSGYGPHFSRIQERFGPMDLAILENGQYNKKWKYTHMQPEQTLQAAKELKTKTLFPVHSARFQLSHHPWDEPLNRITALDTHKLRIIHPQIGEPVFIDEKQKFSPWWQNLR